MVEPRTNTSFKDGLLSVGDKGAMHTHPNSLLILISPGCMIEVEEYRPKAKSPHSSARKLFENSQRDMIGQQEHTPDRYSISHPTARTLRLMVVNT
jgi:hypothetical protein